MIDLFRHLRTHGKKELSGKEKKEMKKKLYGNVSGGKQFDMLSHRLRAKVFDFLLSEITHNKHPVLERLHSAQINIKNKYALYFFLNYTGRSGSVADELLDEAIALAKKYQCYNDLLQLLHSKQMKLGYQWGEKEIDKTAAEIKRYEKCERAVRRASELYYRLVARKKFNAHPDLPSLQKFLRKSIQELDALYAETHAHEVLYFLKLLEMDFFQNEKKFTSAKQKCSELLAVLRSYPSLFTNQRFDYALGNYAQCCIYMGEYASALQLIHQIKYIIPHTLDWLESKEMEFRILFYQKKFTEAKRLLDVMQEHLPDDIEKIRIARMQFFVACTFFMRGDYAKAKIILSTNTLLLKDKSGWAVSIRILELMLLLEQNADDKISASRVKPLDKTAEYQRALRKAEKFFRYNEQSSFISKRDLLLLELLVHAEKENDFTLKKTSRSLSLRERRIRKVKKILSMKKGDYKWDPFGHEIIRHDEWLERVLGK